MVNPPLVSVAFGVPSAPTTSSIVVPAAMLPIPLPCTIENGCPIAGSAGLGAEGAAGGEMGVGDGVIGTAAGGGGTDAGGETLTIADPRRGFAALICAAKLMPCC